jgi:hypothetical protein
MRKTVLAIAAAAAAASAGAQTPAPPEAVPGARPPALPSPPAASPAPPTSSSEPLPRKQSVERGTVLEEVSGKVADIDRRDHTLRIETTSGPVSLSLDRNTMVYTACGLGTVLDVTPGAQIRAGRNADFLAYWVQVRAAPAAPPSTPGQGTGPAGGGSAPAGEGVGPGMGAPPAPPTTGTGPGTGASGRGSVGVTP